MIHAGEFSFSDIVEAIHAMTTSSSVVMIRTREVAFVQGNDIKSAVLSRLIQLQSWKSQPLTDA